MKPMKIASLAIPSLAPTALFSRVGTADARPANRILASSSSSSSSKDQPPPLNPVVEFSEHAIKWVEQSERGPTVSGHFLVHVHSALFDAYAAFEEGTTGAVTDLDDGVRVSPSALPAKKVEDARVYAMADAAYQVVTAMGRTLLNQTYLEIENGEDAAARMAVLLDEAEELRAGLLEPLKLKSGEVDVAQGVSSSVSEAILIRVTEDGSNFQNDYKDTTGYAVKPMFLPVPVITSSRTDYNFLDGSWVTDFLTYDAVAANRVSNPGFAQVHPLVRSGALTLTETYQSLTQHGIFPPDADGGEQFPLTAHWGNVEPFSLSNSSALRTSVFGPYDDRGNLNDEWVEEAREVVDLAYQQQDTNCPKCRAESEYWELGDEFPYPPGWWVARATEIARDNTMDIRSALQVIFGTAIAVFDAGVAAWEMKYFYDTVRPVTTINEIFEGSTVSDWRKNLTAVIDDKDLWRPYQLRRNIVPPFPDIPSGHSAFSTSSSVVLRNLLGTNLFNYYTQPFNSRFDLNDGFDGDPTNGNEDIVLNWKTFSQAADAAGFSRLLGGIHMMQGNIAGLEMGARVGHSTLRYLRQIFGDDSLGKDPVDDVFKDIVFGTGRDDTLLVAPCVEGSPVEVYGFYGDDVLEFNDSNGCGPVSLFGGDGADTFRVGAMATIQDYEAQDIIKLLGEYGTLSISVANLVTTVFVNGVAAVDVGGVWGADELNIIFELFV